MGIMVAKLGSTFSINIRILSMFYIAPLKKASQEWIYIFVNLVITLSALYRLVLMMGALLNIVFIQSVVYGWQHLKTLYNINS
jgi:hypothetical protein